MKIFENYLLSEKDDLVSAITAELKKNGYNRNKCSVRYRSLTMDRAIVITIYDLNIAQETIEKIVKKFEHLSYDAGTGEILTGGNTYIDINYDGKQMGKITGTKEYRNLVQALENNAGKWLQLGSDLRIKLPAGYHGGYGSPNLVYEYEWKGKKYGPRDKDFIKPLGRLLYVTKNEDALFFVTERQRKF